MFVKVIKLIYKKVKKWLICLENNLKKILNYIIKYGLKFKVIENKICIIRKLKVYNLIY